MYSGVTFLDLQHLFNGQAKIIFNHKEFSKEIKVTRQKSRRTF